MFYYFAYGFHICSDLMLPGLQKDWSKDIKTDISIRYSTIDEFPRGSGTQNYLHLDGNTAYMYAEKVGKFVVKNGKEIKIDPFPSVREEAICLLLLGSVLTMALHQRQLLILHGSAVAINDSAAVFIGAKGQGKSTMTAALYARGNKLIADDICAIQFTKTGEPILLPGFPQIKLWSEAVKSTTKSDVAILRKIHPEVEKYAYPTLDNFYNSSCPVKKIYLLGTGSQPQAIPLKGQGAFAALIANLYIPILSEKELIKDKHTPFHLEQCTKLANTASIARLERPRSLDLLDDVARTVEEDMVAVV